MGCCGSKQTERVTLEEMKPVTKASLNLKVYGDYFSSEVRTILASLEFCGVQN